MLLEDSLTVTDLAVFIQFVYAAFQCLSFIDIIPILTL